MMSEKPMNVSVMDMSSTDYFQHEETTVQCDASHPDRYVDFKHYRRSIMDLCRPQADRLMFLWVSNILDQIGNVIIVGMPWNYDKFEQTLLALA